MWFNLALIVTLIACAHAIPLDERSSDVCSSGIYKELNPLKNYPIAVAFCRAKFPPTCVEKKSGEKRATTDKIFSKKVVAKDATASIWAKATIQQYSTISTLCSCIQSHPPCPKSKTSTTGRLAATALLSSTSKSTPTTILTSGLETTPSTTTSTTPSTTSSTTPSVTVSDVATTLAPIPTSESNSATSTSTSTESISTTSSPSSSVIETTPTETSLSQSATPTPVPSCTPGLRCSPADYRYTFHCGEVISSGGNPNPPVPAADPDACTAACDVIPTCQAWSFTYETGICTTYSPLGNEYTVQQATLGVWALYEEGDCPI